MTIVWFHFLHLNIHSNWSLLADRTGGCVCVYKGRPQVPPQSPWACSFPVAGWWSGRECFQLGDLSQLDSSLKTCGQVVSCVNWAQLGAVLVQTDVQIYSWLGAVSEPLGAGFPPCVRWENEWMSVFGTWPLLIEWWWWFLRLLRGQPRSSLLLVPHYFHSPSLGLSCSVICVHVLGCSAFHLSLFPCRFLY